MPELEEEMAQLLNKPDQPKPDPKPKLEMVYVHKGEKERLPMGKTTFDAFVEELFRRLGKLRNGMRRTSRLSGPNSNLARASLHPLTKPRPPG